MKETLNLSTPKTELNNEEGSKLSKLEPFHSVDSSGAAVGMDFSKCFPSMLNSKILETSLHKEIQIHYTKLKLCLLCFAAFPDNSLINRRILMYWWIGEGFIDPLDKEKLICSEDTTDELIKELMAKRLVEPVSRKQHPGCSYIQNASLYRLCGGHARQKSRFL